MQVIYRNFCIPATLLTECAASITVNATTVITTSNKYKHSKVKGLSLNDSAVITAAAMRVNLVAALRGHWRLGPHGVYITYG